MKIFTYGSSFDLPEDYRYPCFFCIEVQYTSISSSRLKKYAITYIDKDGEQIEIGEVLILSQKKHENNLPRSFSQSLPKDWCSAGNDYSYYQELNTIGEKAKDFILTRLNDLAYNSLILNKKINDPDVTEELLYKNETYSAFKKAREKFSPILRIADPSFKYTQNARSAKKSPDIEFDFSEKKHGLNRVFAVAGKNGTGKTQLLARLAKSFKSEHPKSRSFKSQVPKFSRIIAVSCSYFDEFEIPQPSEDFYYVFCGFRLNGKNIPKDNLIRKIQDEAEIIYNQGRSPKWRKCLLEVMKEEELPLKSKSKGKAFELRGTSVLKKLSSGQLSLLLIITALTSSIHERSLVLYDEPEMHLHPNAISGLMRVLFKLLKYYNSYAIVSTHSPIILQELPSDSIRILERIGSTSSNRRPSIECFGQSLTEISREVFQLVDSESFFKFHLDQMIETKSAESIINTFENKLGVGARIYLKSIEKLRKDNEKPSAN